MPNRGDKKAKKARAKGKSDRPTRKPQQKGRVKKALNRREPHAFMMRTELPKGMRAEVESERLQDNGVSPVIAKNIAVWRAQHNLL
jgi:hypothetical protein